MSTSSGSSTDDSIFDIEELLHIEARCRELRREKDLLKETQSQSFDLIKRLELHIRILNEARLEDQRQIQALEGELSDCHQEIDCLQDQLNAKSAEVDGLKERVGTLEMKLVDVNIMEEEIISLREELNKSNSECEFLMQGLDTKETELQESHLQIEKLEESISCAALDYQCEIESMRLEMMALEESSQERARLSELLHELELQFEDAQKKIKTLENEKIQFKNKLDASEKEVKLFCRRVEEHLKGWKESSGNEEVDFGREVGSCGDMLGPLLSRILSLGSRGVDFEVGRENMTRQIHEYEELVKKLKEELRGEKLRAKDEAEDLAQEMAELRYQLTELVEEERKRRACIEQASLQRISELEAKLQMEQRTSVAPISRYI